MEVVFHADDKAYHFFLLEDVTDVQIFERVIFFVCNEIVLLGVRMDKLVYFKKSPENEF